MRWPPILLVKENHQLCWRFRKALSLHSPAGAVSLPLMREVGKIFDFARRERKKRNISPPGFCFAKSSPLVTSARRRCACEQPAKPALGES